MNEFSMMLTGEGKFRQGSQGFVPNLRFLAYMVLCPDCDLGTSKSHTNGDAANVGRRSTTTKAAGLQCVVSLRRTCEDTMLRCRAMSRKAEKNFENNLKMLLMPEFAVPYAFHILAFRPETPSGGFNQSTPPDERSDDEEEDEEGCHKVLMKRLRCLF
jgi:hypothetical protein